MSKEGFYVSKRNAIIIICLFVLIVVAVGLMAGLIKEPCEEYYVYERDDPVNPPLADTPWLDPFLPTYLEPVHYTLWMYPDFYFNGSVFYGIEDIEIRVKQETRFLLLHIKMMDIDNTEVRDADQNVLEIKETFAYEPNQYWVVELEEDIDEDSTVFLHLEFHGSLNNGIVGYYKSNYTNTITGKKSWLATTKFQPSDSRKAFPNFDEPRYKAQYTVTLKHWSNFTALGNMPPVHTHVVEGEEEFNETTFDITPVMSSYLVCFIVCDFEYKENTLASGKPHRVWATPDKINQTDYALRIGKDMFDWFEIYLNMSYQLPKLDHVAVPDYPSGATEHWGLMTYRQTRLLYDPEQLGDSDKQSVATIVAHELTHNYFGNTITCDWWDQIWLNEAPARYFEHMAVDAVTEGPEDPEFMDMMNQFVVRTQQGVMTTDASASSRPVIVPITNPDEATAAFDSITYDKGASMLRMLENMLGENVFVAGLQRFLREHEFQPVNTEDLWDALQAEADIAGIDLDIAHIMDPWTLQMGLPLVDITPSGDQLLASQERFMNDPDADKDEPESPFEYKWDIPLTWRTESDISSEPFWLEQGDETIDDPRQDPDEWLKFNNYQSGFYRVNMPDDMWEALATELENDHEVFHPLDRSHIMNEAFNLARAGEMNYNVVLDLTLYLKNELSYFPWYSAKSGLDYMSEMLYGHVEYGLWRAYVVSIAGPIMDILTTEDQGTHTDKLNRNNIIDLSCGHGHQGCMQNTTLMFLDFLEQSELGINPVDNNLKRKVYQHGMRATGGEDQWTTVWGLYETATSGQEEGNLLYSLAQTDRTWLVQRYLDYCMDDTKIRTQDFFTAVNNLASNPNAIRHVWDWTRAHYDELLERFDLNDRYFGRMVPDMVSGYNTQWQLEEVEAFYDAYPDAGAGERAREQSIDSIKNNIAWLENNEDDIIDWLQQNVAVACVGACAKM